MNTKTTPQSELRRHEDNLITIGSGVVMVGVVSMLQLLLFFRVNASQIQDFFQSLSPAQYSDSLRKFVMAFLFTMVFTGMLIRAYVGLTARAEGMGKKKGYFYIIVAGFIALLDTILVILGFIQLFLSQGFVFDLLVTLALLMVSIVTIAQMIISAIYVKRSSNRVE